MEQGRRHRARPHVRIGNNLQNGDAQQPPLHRNRHLRRLHRNSQTANRNLRQRSRLTTQPRCLIKFCREDHIQSALDYLKGAI